MPDAHLTPPDVRFATIERFVGYRMDSGGGIWTCWKRRCKGKGGGTTFILSDHWRLLKPCVDRYGYLQFLLKDASASRPVRVTGHRMILEAFVGPSPEGMVCRHLNGVRADNRVENLAWGTPAENCADMIGHGTRRFGERASRAKLTEADIPIIRAAHQAGESLNSLAGRFGVRKYSIQLVCQGRTWRHV